jgi:CyaY protein
MGAGTKSAATSGDDAALAEARFERAADEALSCLVTQLEDVDGLEADLEMGILTLEFDDGTRYVVNSHRAARQIWMAADRSAWHFDFDERNRSWRASRDGGELAETLSRVASQKLGRPLALRLSGAPAAGA